MPPVADCDPSSLHEIQVAGKPLYGSGLKIQRIVSEQDLLVWLAHDFESALNIFEESVPRADVVMRFAGFQVLPAVVQLNLPCSRGFEGSVGRSEEHTSELSHTVISYAVFCLKKKKNNNR